MRVVTVGGGPAGLYFALLMKKADASHEVVVLERNHADDTFGWGVVFSDQTMENFRHADRPTFDAITDHFAHWDDIDVHVRGVTVTSGGHGFSGIARRTLLQLLQARCRELGVELRFGCDVGDASALASLGLADHDVLVAADGINSMLRRTHAGWFHPSLDVRSARYIWLGTTRRFDAFTFAFVEADGGVYQAHAYRFDERTSAFIVECDEASWRAAGFDRMSTGETIATCERMFAPWLDGHALMSNARHLRGSAWLQFVRVSNERWHHDRIVLIGDAAHTAHFSIGSGTKLAMEDAIALARVLGPLGANAAVARDDCDRIDAASLTAAYDAYQSERQTEALRLQNAARNSMEWFENVRRYIHLEPMQFAYSLLTRSQRVSHENLRLRDAAYLTGVERWFAARAGRGLRGRDLAGRPDDASAGARSAPPLFTPFALRGLTLPNRVVVSPMDMYCAVDGEPNDFHLVHYGARALGGAGLVVTEMTCVSPEARITPGCTGLYAPAHVAAWTRIVRFVHESSAARIALQLGHSGRKGSTKPSLEESDIPLGDGNWPLVAPSALAHRPTMQVPRAMTRDDMRAVRDQFADAARLAIGCDFDMLELHCAHGYLLSSFITPLSNRRDDEYGGSLENRLRFPLEVFDAMRAVWPPDRPISVRISATDWVEGGVTGEESVRIARAFADAGADIIHVSTGQTSSDARPVYGRMWQTPYADRIRNEARVPTIAVGSITDADQMNSIIAAGRADLCALGRPHLADPAWTLRAAAELGYEAQWWPRAYLAGKAQMEREIARRREMERAASELAQRAMRDAADAHPRGKPA